MKSKENKSLFLKYFGDTPQLRVMDFLMDNEDFDYPITEIARGSNVSYNSIVAFFYQFVETGIISKTRKRGKSDYYKINLENNFVRKLMQIDWILTENNAYSIVEIKTPLQQRKKNIDLKNLKIA